VAETKTETNNTVKEEKPETEPAKTTAAKATGSKSEPTALSLASSASPAHRGAIEIASFAGDRPLGASQMEVFGTFTSSGDRPIEASHFEVYGMILNNRPIMASHIEVLNLPVQGGSPIFASDLIVRDDLTLPGGRPIVASDPRLMDADLLMGGRPIAANDLTDDSSAALMGYID